MMTKQVPEPNAELLSSEDVHEDVMVLTATLERRSAERQAYRILSRPDIQEMIKQAISSGVCATEEEAIARALKTLITAIS